MPEVVEDLKIKCLKKFPKSKIVGVYSPPFRKLNNQEKNDIINDINKCNPNFIWVGLGLPKQENWIMDNINKINELYRISKELNNDFQEYYLIQDPEIVVSNLDFMEQNRKKWRWSK